MHQLIRNIVIKIFKYMHTCGTVIFGSSCITHFTFVLIINIQGYEETAVVFVLSLQFNSTNGE